MARRELQPCPFCGGTELQVGELMARFFVECGGCAASGPVARTRVGAGDAWSRAPRRLVCDDGNASA